MKHRSIATILGIAIVAGAAIFIGRYFLKPAEERAEAKKTVLSGAYEPRVEACRFLEDHELPEPLEAPEIGSPTRYVEVVVLFPQAATIAGQDSDLRLDRVNGQDGAPLAPVHVGRRFDEDGAYLTLIFLVDESFDSARLIRGKKPVVERVLLD